MEHNNATEDALLRKHQRLCQFYRYIGEAGPQGMFYDFKDTVREMIEELETLKHG